MNTKQVVKRKMQQEEIWAEEYLRYRSFTKIEFEPCGNRTPDFLVDKRIAVEVRRLNQQRYTEAGTIEALDDLGQPFIRNLLKLLKSFDQPVNGVSWYVSCEFDRPQLTEKWKPLLEEKLALVDDALLGEQIIPIDENLSFTLTRASKPQEQRFEMGREDDQDMRGWAVPELEKSLNFCIAKKTAAIVPGRIPEMVAHSR